MIVLRLALPVALVVGVVLGVEAPGVAAEQSALEFFTRRGCPRCDEAKSFIVDLVRERPDLVISTREVDVDLDARRHLEALASAAGIRTVGVPAFAVEGRLLVGWIDRETTGRAVQGLLAGSSLPPLLPDGTQPFMCSPQDAVPCPAGDTDVARLPLLGGISARGIGLPLFTVIFGLVDGFNPCAMWVLMYLLAILVNVRSRAKMLAIAGTFVLVSGIVYFAFMAAWLSFFRVVGYSRAVQMALGAVALAFGGLNVKDALAFGRGPSLSISEGAKPRIYARIRAIVQAEHLPAAIAGAVVLAFLVNAVELLCTAGLPAVYTNILAARGLPSWQYHGYLALYNVAYMLDDSIVLGIAVVTLSRHKLQERGGRVLKAVSGIVMLMLGILLIARPDWLR